VALCVGLSRRVRVQVDLELDLQALLSHFRNPLARLRSALWSCTLLRKYTDDTIPLTRSYTSLLSLQDICLKPYRERESWAELNWTELKSRFSSVASTRVYIGYSDNFRVRVDCIMSSISQALLAMIHFCSISWRLTMFVFLNQRVLWFSDLSHNSLRVIGRKTLKGAPLLRNL